jgi:drug/metabolite transporter (DMT)-like permease
MRLALIATPRDKTQRIQGFVAVTLAGMMWGLLGLFGKTAFARGLSPGEFLSLRFLVSAIALTAFVLAWAPKALALPAKQLGRIALLGIFGTAVVCTLYFEALKRLPASLCVLIFYANPVLIAAGAWLCFGQKPGKRTLIALPLALLGVVLLVAQDLETGSADGIALCLVSAGVYSVYVLFASRWLKGINSMISSCYILISGAAALTLAHLRSWDRAVETMAASWDLILWTAGIATVVPMILLFWGLNKLRPAEVGLLSTVEPVAGVIIAVTILGEHLTLAQAAGGAIVVGSLIFMAFEAPPGRSLAIERKKLLITD